MRLTLQRAHVYVAMIAIGLAGLALTVSGLLALQVYAQNNLNVLARSLAYTAEAAVVFGDQAAAQEALLQITETEPLANARLLDRDGRVLASYQRPLDSSVAWLQTLLAPILLPSPVRLPIVHDGEYAGSLEVSAHGAETVCFLLRGVAVMAVCLLLSALIAIWFSRRMVERLATPLREFADVAHRVRVDRGLHTRVGLSGIAELDELGRDFNALLDEIEQRQTSLQDENADLAHKATHDGLTGLPNRALFEAQLTLALSAAGASDERLALLYLDCNEFKSINDTLGHAAGDRVLVEVARRARRHLRETDLLARLGGDEFVALIRPVDDVVDAQVLTDDILASMRKPISLGSGARVTVSTSIGIALYPIHALTTEALLAAADTAMYRAKQSNRRGTSALAELPFPV